MINTEPKTIVTLSRLDQQQSSWMSEKRVLPEDERRELRIWMRRKQRERLAVYQKHRESLKEREHKPFSSPGAVVRCVCVSIMIDILFYVVFFKILLPQCHLPAFPLQKPLTKNRAGVWRTREEKKKYVQDLFLLFVHKRHACV